MSFTVIINYNLYLCIIEINIHYAQKHFKDISEGKSPISIREGHILKQNKFKNNSK